MNISQYTDLITAEFLMGPNSMRILGELLEKHPIHLSPDDLILDLGCGKGLTSLILASETPAKVIAADLWISEEENNANFVKWGIADRVTALQADGNALPFVSQQFDALISVDSYHYFAAKPGFFDEKILPFLKNGAVVRIGIPGIKDAFADRAEELLTPWLGEEAHMFKSPAQWRKLIGDNERIANIHVWEMDCFESAWQDWFSTGHEYAVNDRAYYETILKPCTCFVGISIALK